MVGVLPMLLSGQLHRRLPCPSGAGFASYLLLSDAYSDIGGSGGYHGYESFSLRFSCKPLPWYN